MIQTTHLYFPMDTSDRNNKLLFYMTELINDGEDIMLRPIQQTTASGIKSPDRFFHYSGCCLYSIKKLKKPSSIEIENRTLHSCIVISLRYFQIEYFCSTHSIIREKAPDVLTDGKKMAQKPLFFCHTTAT